MIERIMGLALEMAFRYRKIVVISLRTCYRSVRKYPFLAGLLCFLVLLYRSCPFLFSLLVSASPILICTAVLLGTLLSFGQPNIPEIEADEEVSYDASSRSRLLENAAEDENFTVDRFKVDKVDNYFMETDFAEDRTSGKLEELGGLVDFAPLIRETDCEFLFEKVEVEKVVEREFHSSELENKRGFYEENLDVRSLAMDGENVVESQHFLLQSTKNENLDMQNYSIPIEPLHKREIVNLSTNYNDKNDSDSSDYGSDLAESSSPDASMADIIPMLDELHPLLDLEAPQPIHRSNVESDASSEQSHDKSDGECAISDDDDVVNQGGEVGVFYNDEEEEDDDEGLLEEKEDCKSAIKWTEDDQKNLMDLGSLELERNQRLENLIARRRARNNLRMLAGKNLIDLDGFELPTNVPPITTARKNPFDLPYDSYDNMGLPPIPGSAPSILLPRRNPFDLPYDPNEEKPDLKGDDFEQEFLTSQQRDTFFRRRESFNVGASSFEIFKQEQQNIRWKPYFTMPEKIASEGTSYPLLERQLSEVSETKQSSASDTESVSSITDQNDKKHDESQSFLERATVSYLDHAAIHIEHGNGSWEDVNAENFVQVENRDVHHEVIEITLGSTEGHFDCKSGSSEIGAVDSSTKFTASEIHSKHEVADTEYNSNSSLSSLPEIDEKTVEAKIDEVNLGSSHMEESSITMQPSLEDADFKISIEPGASEIHPKTVLAETDYNSNSSLSSFSEVNDKPFEVKTDEGKPSFSHVEESGMSIQSTLEDTYFKIASEVLDENQHKEPVYDSSPSAKGMESEVHSEIGQDDTSDFEDMLARAASSGLYLADENELESRDVLKVIEHRVTMVESSNAVTNLDSQNLSVASELLVEHVSNSGLSLGVESTEMGTKDDIKDDKDCPSSHEGKIFDEIHQIEDEKVGYSASSDQISSQSLTFAEPEEQLSTVGDHVSAHTVPSSDAKPVEMHGELNGEENSEERAKFYTSSSSNSSFAKEVILQNEALCHADQAYVSASSHGSEIPTLELHDIVTSSVATSHEHLTATDANFPRPQEQHSLVEGEQVVAISSSSTFPSSESEQDRLDKSLFEPPLNDREDIRETDTSPIDSAAKIICKDITPEVHQDVSAGLSSMASDSTSISSGNHAFKSPSFGAGPKDDIVDEVSCEGHDEISKHLDSLAEAYGVRFSENMIKEEVDEITEIDEELLSELDEVGDFSVIEVGDIEKKIPKEAQIDRTNFYSLSESSNLTETKAELPILEARSIDDINLAFRQLHEGVDVEEIVLPIAVENQAKDEAKVEPSSDLEVVEARSLGDIHVALVPVSENNSSELPRNFVSNEQSIENQVKEEAKGETSSNLEVFEARSLGDIHVALTQVSKNNSMELPKNFVSNDQSIENQVNEEAEGETSSDLEVVEAKSLGDIHVALMQVSETNSSELSKNTTSNERSIENQVKEEATGETSSNLEVVEVRSLGDIHVALMQVSETNSSELSKNTTSNDRSIENQVKEEATGETSSDLEVVEARSLGDIHVALMQVSENNSSELPNNSVSNDQSVVEEPAGTNSLMEIASSNTTDANKPADITDEKYFHPDITVSNTKEKRKKNSKSGSSSSSSSSSDSD